MSEFPWEVKKDSSKESPGNSDVSDKNNAGPSIPDILANAFSGASMEEVAINSIPSSDMAAKQDVQPNIPDFGNLADLSELTPSDVQAPATATSKSPGNLPPFLQSGSTDEGAKKNAENPSPDSFNIDEITFNPPKMNSPTSEVSSPPQRSARKSPPPLFMPVFPGEGVSEPVAQDFPAKSPDVNIGISTEGGPAFSPETSTLGNDAGIASPFMDLSHAPVNSGQDTNHFQEKKPDFGNPFPEISLSSEEYFKEASNSDNPFSQTMPNFNGQLPDYVEPSANPFSATLSGSENLQQNTAQQNGNPFLSPFESTGGNTPDPANPFSNQTTPSADPFAASTPAPVNPFSNPAPQPSSPFPDFPANAANPFQGQGASSSRQSPLDRIGSIGASINVDKFVRNLDGVGGKFRSLLSNLTKGQSLLERMDELAGNDDVVNEQSFSPFDEATSLAMSLPPSLSQADEQPFSSFDPVIPGSVVEEDMKEPMKESPFVGITEQPDSQDIRQVTPIAEPLMEIREEQRMDFSTLEENEIPEDFSMGLENGISRTIPVDIPKKEGNSSSQIDNLPDNSEMPDDLSSVDASTKATTVSEDELARMGQMSSDVQDLRSGLESMLSRFEDVEGNISDLSENVSGFEPLLSTVKGTEELLTGTSTKVASLEGKVSNLEVKVYDIENALVSVQSDNEDIKSSLTRIEENISELVSSYTALLVQVHESAQENDSRFSQIESALEVLGPFESRFSAIEKMQGEAKSTTMELARSVSSLVDGLGMTSSGLEEFKQNCELRQDKLEGSLDTVTDYLDGELKKLGARSYKGFGQNVHLSNIMKNSSNMKLCMEWLEFLMGLVGRNNLPDILSYYEELGWITEEVRSELLHYAEGIDFYMEKPDWKLTPDDHVKSIWFIESLAGMKVDKNKLSVIERDIEKVKKGNEIYGI